MTKVKKRQSLPAAVLRTMRARQREALDADPEFRATVDAEFTAMEIADKLADFRRQRKVSQVQLGKMLGVSQSMIAQLEAGNAKNIEVRTLVRYVTALDGSVEFKIRRRRRLSQAAV